mmetsp:Transcript_61430/g.190798  ORF Transcript_61430/g.190798 Transcript_61430/m.190798 type:complete len:230 (-) Transcript_61430:128-817(-)
MGRGAAVQTIARPSSKMQVGSSEPEKLRSPGPQQGCESRRSQWKRPPRSHRQTEPPCQHPKRLLAPVSSMVLQPAKPRELAARVRPAMPAALVVRPARPAVLAEVKPLPCKPRRLAAAPVLPEAPAVLAVMKPFIANAKPQGLLAAMVQLATPAATALAKPLLAKPLGLPAAAMVRPAVLAVAQLLPAKPLELARVPLARDRPLQQPAGVAGLLAWPLRQRHRHDTCKA